jgi:hypothetical protein
MLGGLATVMFMSRRRLALAPLVAFLLCGLVGGPTASAAPSSSSTEKTATAAAKKKKKKAKKPTVSSLDKRLKKTEKDLVAARRQLRLVQRATAGLVSGLDTISGANGSLEALLYGGGITEALGPEFAKFEGLLGEALAKQAEQNANAAVVALQNPALRPQLEKLLTDVFGVSPAVIGQSVASLGPTVQAAVGQLIQQEQPVIIVRSSNGDQAESILGPDVPDDTNPVTVSASVPLKVTGNGTLQVLAGIRTSETDAGQDEVSLDSVEVTAGAGVTVSDGSPAVRVRDAAVTIPSGARLSRTSDPRSLPALDLGASTGLKDPVGNAASAVTLTGTTGYVMVRVTARFRDTSLAD